MTPHVVQRLLLAEELVRRRRADEHRRHVSSQRAARIDPNPHQIDAVLFALARLPDGGCILADEVGLGKTIEAGLVIAQLRAEGARRILVVTPKALLGQWKQELFTLFGIDAREVLRAQPDLDGAGVFLATRDFVGGELGAGLLGTCERFDLCVVDEAHEIFAGIYRRFDRHGGLKREASAAQMAYRASEAMRSRGTPMLLLTATPIQNSLLELWGLVHYVDPSGTLLGDLKTFREVFCPADDRVLARGQEPELRRRLGTVLQRTLRRQAQEFMREPFMGRRPELFEYTMSPEERALYDDITTYLLEPGLYAFRGSQRQLLLIGFHRRMASSLDALGKSLEHVAARLRDLLDGRDRADEDRDAIAAEDLESDVAYDEATDEAPLDPSAAAERIAIEAELARVESFIQRATALPTDSKALALLKAVRLVAEQGKTGRSSGKVVIFTEYLATQDYLARLLVEDRVPAEAITLFRGDNDTPRGRLALDRWLAEVGAALSAENRPSNDVATRLALVHEFRTRSQIFIATEAGAKGLNLQFCDTVVNYDLPWNPQRIEQRIGRCHRYAQRRDVTVVNFLASDNEAQRLTYEILEQKLELFGSVLGATDDVLSQHKLAPGAIASVVGNELETRLRQIYDRARTMDEVARELRELRDAIGAKKLQLEAAQARTEEVIQRRFDTVVRQAFHRIQEELPGELAGFDRDALRVVTGYLQAAGAAFAVDGARLVVEPSPALPPPLAGGVHCSLGPPPAAADSLIRSLHLGHPLVVAAVAEARAAAAAARFEIRCTAASPATRALRGQRGRLQLHRIAYHGFEAVDRVVPLVVLDGAAGPLDAALARELLGGTVVEAAVDAAHVDDRAMADALDELVFVETTAAGDSEHARFERTIDQVEQFLGDRIMLREREREAAVARFGKAVLARDTAVGSEQRDRAEAALVRSQEEIDRIDLALDQLRGGDDAGYVRGRAHAQERRYARPEVTMIFDATIEVV